ASPTSGGAPGTGGSAPAPADAGRSGDTAPVSADGKIAIDPSKLRALHAAVPDSAPSPASALIDQPAPADPALTDPAQRYHLLVQLFKKDMGKGPPLPPLAEAIESGGKKKDQPPPDFGAANAELEAALLQKSPVPDTELETLGKHRARAI